MKPSLNLLAPPDLNFKATYIIFYNSIHTQKWDSQVSQSCITKQTSSNCEVLVQIRFFQGGETGREWGANERV